MTRITVTQPVHQVRLVLSDRPAVALSVPAPAAIQAVPLGLRGPQGIAGSAGVIEVEDLTLIFENQLL